MALSIIPQNSNSVFRCNPFNMDGVHAQMEMLLSSLFDSSYNTEPKSLIASNGSLEYIYKKEAVGNRMSLRVVSLEAPRPKFSVRYVGQAFPIHRKEHPLLDLSEMSSKINSRI
jgi:hypothetical protein